VVDEVLSGSPYTILALDEDSPDIGTRIAAQPIHPESETTGLTGP
jgi:hypothetical protein